MTGDAQDTTQTDDLADVLYEVFYGDASAGDSGAARARAAADAAHSWFASHAPFEEAVVEARVRAQIADALLTEARPHDAKGFSAVGDAYAHAARIARGK